MAKVTSKTAARLIYFNRLNIASLLSALFLYPKLLLHRGQIHYFDEASRAAKWLLMLLGCKPQIAIYFWGDIQKENGGLKWLEFYTADIIELLREIRESCLDKDSFLLDLGGEFKDVSRVRIYMEKKLYPYVHSLGIRTNAIQFSYRCATEKSGEIPIFFVQNLFWLSFLQNYGRKVGVEVKGCYAAPISWHRAKKLLALLSRVPRIMYGVLRSRKKGSAVVSHHEDQPQLEKEGTKAEVEESQANIGVLYNGYAISSNPCDRVELFWLRNSQIKRSSVKVYFERQDKPLDESGAACLSEEGIDFIALSTGAKTCESGRVWKPTKLFWETGCKLIWRLIRIGSANWLRGNFSPLFYYVQLGELVYQYAFWTDFFSVNQIKLNVNYGEFTDPRSVGSQFALRDLGGITVSYQVSNMGYANVDLVPCANVVFTFSNDYESLWADCKPAVEQFVPIGYIWDYAFEIVKKRAATHRQSLLDNGVNFIICFFDENSSNDMDSIESNEGETLKYEQLIRFVLQDESIGLVCKPKNPNTLDKKIKRILPLVEELRRTGRLLLLDNDATITSVFPAEAAAMSDVVIGSLVGTTAVVESFLAGTPGVLIDTLEMYKSPIYEWGRGKVVFDNWADLFAALDAYRRDREGAEGFGDWTSVLDSIDPFRDGQAAQRMGEYLSLLFGFIESAYTPEAAMENAAKRYREAWGVEVRQHGYINKIHNE